MFDKNLHCHKKQEFYPKPVLLLSKSAKTGKQKVLQGKMDKNSITLQRYITLAVIVLRAREKKKKQWLHVSSANCVPVNDYVYRNRNYSK